MSHYAPSLCRFWPINCVFWPIETLNLAVPPLLWPVNCIKIGRHVALQSGPAVYSLYCDHVLRAGLRDVSTQISPCSPCLCLSALSSNGTLILILLHINHFFFVLQYQVHKYLGEMIWQYGNISTPTFKYRAVFSRGTHSVILHWTKVFECLNIFCKPKAFYMTS